MVGGGESDDAVGGGDAADSGPEFDRGLVDDGGDGIEGIRLQIIEGMSAMDMDRYDVSSCTVIALSSLMTI